MVVVIIEIVPETICTPLKCFAHSRPRSSRRAQVPWFTLGNCGDMFVKKNVFARAVCVRFMSERGTRCPRSKSLPE